MSVEKSSFRRVHYVLSSHWDREWYQPFQEYRRRLMHLMDEVLEGLASGRLRGPFHTDGQAIVLEDYLEVRPEQRATIERFAQEGKLQIGPWYVLPDEFLVSGESLIRNLQMGRALARKFGSTPCNAGFVCDLFGHTGQLPQILSGFGVRGALVWRGINCADKRNLIWEGSDGTRLACYRFGLHGYCSFANKVRHANDPAHKVSAEQVLVDTRHMLDDEAAKSQVQPLLLFDGGDHQAWDKDVYDILFHATNNKALAGYELIHSTLDAYLNELLVEADRITTNWRGEMREPARYPEDLDSQWLIPGVASSRVWAKQQNAECQTLLCHWAEPLAGLSSMLLGHEYPQEMLNIAWRWLLKNHPHDSIGGCSIDTVHEDMKFRFSQCRQIGEQITAESSQRIAAAASSPIDDDTFRLVVFNPLPYPFDGVTSLTVGVPTDWPTYPAHFQPFEHKPFFQIEDLDGNELAFQIVSQQLDRTHTRLRPCKFPECYKLHEVSVSLPLQIPAMGYTSLVVKRGDIHHFTHRSGLPGLATSERSMGNKFLEVVIDDHGSLSVTDRQSGVTYHRLITFEDAADIGDGWYHGRPTNDQIFASSASHADVCLLHDGPYCCTFRITLSMCVPACFDHRRGQRADYCVEMAIISDVSLRLDAQHLEVCTRIDNHCKDHRVRVLMPTGAQASTFLTDAAFDVVQRPIALRSDNPQYREPEVETKPQQSWSAVFDDKRGLAVISTGLHEVTVRDQPDRPIALTLFRATGRTVMTDGEPEGQLLGPMAFRYWIVPLQGEPDRSRLFQMAQRMAAGLRTVRMSHEDLALYQPNLQPLPPRAGWISLSSPAIMTSAMRAGDTWQVRLFNPCDTAVTTRLHFNDNAAAALPHSAQCVNLDGVPIDKPMPICGRQLELAMRPKQILTIQLLDTRTNSS